MAAEEYKKDKPSQDAWQMQNIKIILDGKYACQNNLLKYIWRKKIKIFKCFQTFFFFIYTKNT